MGRAYNGYMLSADNSRLSDFKSAVGRLGEQLDAVIASARSKYTQLETYAAADPTVAVTLEDNLDTVKESVSTVETDVLANIENIINAIDDYQDGNWSPENKAFIDNFLSANGKNPQGAPAGNPGGGGGAGGAGADTDENLTPEENPAENIQSTVPVSDETTTSDEEIVMGQVEGVSGEYNAEAVVPFTGEDEELAIGEDEVDGSSSLGTSLFGSGSTFSVPSPLGDGSNVDGIKSSSILGAAGIAAAAAAAIGGKVFYDKKHSDEDEDVEIDEDISKLNEESGSDVSSGFMSGLSSVDFKNELLNDSEVDE